MKAIRSLVVVAILCLVVALGCSRRSGSPGHFHQSPLYLENLSANRYDPNSTSNPYGKYGSRYSRYGINNRYGRFGNPYTVNAPRIYGADGTYLGRLSSNRYAPESVGNPYGRYGSRYSPQSINNPYGRFGSRYSPTSANNPYATDPPRIVSTDD